MLAACRKNPVLTSTPPVNKLVSMDQAVFDTTTSKRLATHTYAFDTTKAAYALNGFGAFAGKTRTVKFSDGGSFRNFPVVKATGFSDYGSSFFAKDTAGTLWEIYQQRFNTTDFTWPVPITVFAPATPNAGTQWNAWPGYEQGRNSQYYSFAVKVAGGNTTTSTGIAGCIELIYTAPDYADTVFIKPGRGPAEIRSWRAHLYENNQPAAGGYR